MSKLSQPPDYLPWHRWHDRYFQGTQSLFLVTYSTHTSDVLTKVLVFDTCNNHWLDPAQDMKEVGYNSDLGPSEKVLAIQRLVAT